MSFRYGLYKWISLLNLDSNQQPTDPKSTTKSIENDLPIRQQKLRNRGQQQATTCREI